jgi:lambda repressor-like predicted transcriptional regulator
MKKLRNEKIKEYLARSTLPSPLERGWGRGETII